MGWVSQGLQLLGSFVESKHSLEGNSPAQSRSFSVVKEPLICKKQKAHARDTAKDFLSWIFGFKLKRNSERFWGCTESCFQSWEVQIESFLDSQNLWKVVINFFPKNTFPQKSWSIFISCCFSHCYMLDSKPCLCSLLNLDQRWYIVCPQSYQNVWEWHLDLFWFTGMNLLALLQEKSSLAIQFTYPPSQIYAV